MARERARGWAVLGMADGFFEELDQHAHVPSELSVRHLTDDPILSRFADDPRNDELIRAMGG
ncbi:MAG: hypothetical protein ABFS34_00985 [Gemmatimonadota bacterium]